MNNNISEGQARSALNNKEREAQELLKDEMQTGALLDKANGVLNKIKKIPIIGDLVDDITTTIELIGDYVKGNYREVPVRIIVSALAAIIYLVSPIDLIPDFIPIAGYFDDAMVLSIALSTGLSLELKKYRKFKFGLVKDTIVRVIQENLVNKIHNSRLVAAFITDDNNLKLLLVDSQAEVFEPPIEVRPVILGVSFPGIRYIRDELKVMVTDVIEEAVCGFRVKINNCEPIKVCRESDFKEFDDIFEVLTEEE